MIPIPRLYAIADASFGDPVELAELLFAGGARLVQIRNKNAGARELLKQAERILANAPEDARVIVNDRVDIARISAAAGVHVGQGDLPPAAARRILGPDFIIGVSTHHSQQAIEADREPVDYVALGPIFPTLTKTNADPVVGTAVLSDVCGRLRSPVVAIGGITLENVREIFAAGAAAAAVIRGLLSGSNIVENTRRWVEACRVA